MPENGKRRKVNVVTVRTLATHTAIHSRAVDGSEVIISVL